MTFGEEPKTSPWVYVALGFGIFCLLAVLVIGGIGFYGYRKVQQVTQEMNDPVTRTAKVKAVLGAAQLPEGYHAFMSFSIPFLMDMVILSDKEPLPEREAPPFSKRGFIYFKFIRAGKEPQQMRDYFEGKTDDARPLRQGGVHLDSKELVTRGVLQVEGQTLLYAAHRGQMNVHSDRAEGLLTIILIECPNDQKMRTGIWFGPDPSPERPAAETDFTGTPADESAIRAFMTHFKTCGG